MFDMMKMMGKLKEVQEKMKEAQTQLASIIVEAEAGAGMVKATVQWTKGSGQAGHRSQHFQGTRPANGERLNYCRRK